MDWGTVAQWGAFSISLLALLRPEIESRLKGNGAIDIYEAGSISIGFGPFGPTVTLNGTLRALHRDQFVRSVEVIVTRMRDKATYNFQWFSVQNSLSLVGSQQDQQLNLPTSFMLTTEQPQRFTIAFTLPESMGEVSRLVSTYTEAWNRWWVNDIGSGKSLELLFSEFVNSVDYDAANRAIDRANFWDPGEYSLDFKITTARPTSQFTRNWTFQISDVDSKALRVNTWRVLRGASGQTISPYAFAYAQYLEPTTPRRAGTGSATDTRRTNR